MTTRRQLMAALAAALAVSACRAENDAGRGGPTELRVGILAVDRSPNLKRYWAPVLSDMEKATGLRVKPFFSTSHTALVDAMRFKQTDVGWLSNEAALEAVRRANAEVFARTTNPPGVEGERSLLIVGAKSGLTLERVLKCDRKLTLGVGDPRSISGALAPLTYLFAPRGVSPEACFKLVRAGAERANLLSLAEGQLNVATSTDQALELAEREGLRGAADVKVIWRSDPLPEDPIVWRKDLDPAVKEKVRQFLLTYGQGDGPDAFRQRANLARLGVGGFAPADDTHLLPAREIEATREWLEASQTRDAGRIAAAKRRLDEVRGEREALEQRTRAPAGAQ